MKRLIIHAGLHKTGTTSTQRALAESADLLASHGISYFNGRLGRGQRDRRKKAPWIKTDRSQIAKGRGASVRRNLFSRAAECDNATVVISNEGFSWIFEPEEIDRLARMAAEHFEQVQVVFYIRRQDRLLVSHFQQASRDRNSISAAFYGTVPKALPVIQDGLDLYLDHERRIRKWVQILGEENVKVRVMERGLIQDDDTTRDFFGLLGVEPPTNISRANSSYGIAATKVGHILNQRGDKLDWRWLLKELNEAGGLTRMLPARADAEAIYARYRESNMRLNEWLSLSPHEAIFEEDFSLYPEQPGDVWTEETANVVIDVLLDALRRYQTIPDLAFEEEEDTA